jgi:hypothetical protein
MNWRKFTVLLISFCLVAWFLADFVYARGGGRGGGGGFSRGGGGGTRGGGSFSRGSGGSYGSIRNSSRPSTREVSRPSTRDSYHSSEGIAHLDTSSLSRPSGDYSNRPTQGDLSENRSQTFQDRASNLTPDQKQALQNRADSLTPEQKQSLQDKASSLTPEQKQQIQEKASNLTPEQKEQIKDRAENLTPEQKEELRQKYEESGLTPGQLPSEISDADREDWQEWRDDNREDWQDWYEDEYDDYWDDHYHSTWWYGYPVSSVSYSFYVDNDPPCQNKVVVNQATGYTTYYQCNSVWYQPAYASGDVKYVVTSPPAGAELTTLSNPYTVTVDGQVYFVSNHAFYQRIFRNGQALYVSVDAPIGAQVPTIPQYAVEIKHQGQSYYRFDKIFYQRQGDAFVVVANPGV